MSKSELKRKKIQSAKKAKEESTPKAPALTKELLDEQVELIRASLIKAIFEKYHPLVDLLKKLPLAAELPGIQYGLLSIDTGMLWFKEMLSTSPLSLTPVTFNPPIPPNGSNPSENEVKEDADQKKLKKSA